MVVHIDFESRSAVDLRRVGVHVYAAHPSTQVICAAYAIDDGPVKLWRLGQRMPSVLAEAVLANAEWHAWNAQYERVMWRECLVRAPSTWGIWTPPLEDWHCSMARAALCGLPLSLAAAAKAAQKRLSHDVLDFRRIADFTEIPDDKFEIVVMIDVLHHIPPDRQRDGRPCRLDHRDQYGQHQQSKRRH
jgi:hypothetical protein